MAFFHFKETKMRRATSQAELAEELALQPVITLSDPPKLQVQKVVEEIDFRELSDGTLLETIADPSEPGGTALAVFQNGEILVKRKFELGDRILLPLPITLQGVRHINFAKGAEHHEAAKSLWVSIIALLNQTLDLAAESLCLVAAYVLSTWLLEKLPVAPYLSLVGPPGSGKTTALRVLQLVCRRSLATADFSSAAFYDLSENVTTTLLIDEAATLANRQEIFHMMRAGSTPGFVTLRKNQSYRLFGARVFAWTELPDDAALNSRCLIIPMKCSSRQNLRTPSDPAVLKAAARLQQKLLHFRLSNYATVRLRPIAGDDQLQPRARDLLRCLAAPFAGEPGTTGLLLETIRGQQTLHDMLKPQQAAAIGVLFDMMHELGDLDDGGKWQFRFSYLQNKVNERLKEQGEATIQSGKQMGGVLTSLGVTDRKKTNRGTELMLSRATWEQVHELQRMHKIGTQSTQEQMDNCPHCKAKGEDSTTPSKDPRRTRRAARSELGEDGELESEGRDASRPTRL
jgi:hypothetical protein